MQANAGALQRFHGVDVADERALHVVDAEAVDEPAFNHGLWFVADARKKFFAASVRCIHVAIEHQVLAAARAFPTADHIGAPFFDFLPGNLEADLLQRGFHVLRHLQFFASRAGNVDHIGRHGQNFFFADPGKDAVDEFRIERWLRVGGCSGHS